MKPCAVFFFTFFSLFAAAETCDPSNVRSDVQAQLTEMYQLGQLDYVTEGAISQLRDDDVPLSKMLERETIAGTVFSYRYSFRLVIETALSYHESPAIVTLQFDCSQEERNQALSIEAWEDEQLIDGE